MHVSRTIAVAALAVAALLGRAHAQGVNCDMAGATDVSDSAKAAIAAHVHANGAGLAGDDAAIRKARSALLGPLRCNAVSLNFRAEYSRALLPVLAPLVQDANGKDQPAANALRLAGELATPQSVPLITKAMTDKRSSVRYAACFAAGRVFDAVKAPRAAAIGATEMDQLFEALDAFVKAETDSNLLDAAVLALGTGTSITTTTIPQYDARSRAVETLANAIGAKAKSFPSAPSDKTLEVLLRAESNLREVFLAIAGGGGLSNSASVAVAGLAGDILALASRSLKANPSPARRELLASVVTAAEAVLRLSGQSLRKNDVPNLNLGNLVRSGKDSEFGAELSKYTGASGMLTQPPFGFPSSRFQP